MVLNEFSGMNQHVLASVGLDKVRVKLQDFILVNDLLGFEENSQVLGSFVDYFAELLLTKS